MSLSNVSIKSFLSCLVFGLWSSDFGLGPLKITAGLRNRSTTAVRSKTDAQRPKTISLVTQRHDWMDVRCPPRRQVTRQQSRAQQHQCGGAEGHKISRLYVK